MKKNISIFVVFAIVLALAGCGTADISSPPLSSESVESYYTRSVISDSESISYPPPEEGFINTELLGLIRAENSSLKAMRNEACAAINIGSKTDAVYYYNPYMGVFFVSKGPGGWAVDKEDFRIEFNSNPYVDDILICDIMLKADFEPSLHTVYNQDSLKQLFTTDELITLDLLENKLGRELTLTNEPDYSWFPIVEYNPIADVLQQPVRGGGYRTTFVIGSSKITVYFIKAGNDFIAVYASFFDVDPEWIW